MAAGLQHASTVAAQPSFMCWAKLLSLSSSTASATQRRIQDRCPKIWPIDGRFSYWNFELLLGLGMFRGSQVSHIWMCVYMHQLAIEIHWITISPTVKPWLEGLSDTLDWSHTRTFAARGYQLPMLISQVKPQPHITVFISPSSFWQNSIARLHTCCLGKAASKISGKGSWQLINNKLDVVNQLVAHWWWLVQRVGEAWWAR